MPHQWSLLDSPLSQYLSYIFIHIEKYQYTDLSHILHIHVCLIILWFLIYTSLSFSEMRLYIADKGNSRISSIDVNGTSQLVLDREYDHANDIYSLAVDEKYLYYSEWRGK